VHESLLERWESKKYFGYNLMANSINYPSAFQAILGVVINYGSQNVGSMFSLTGVEKLDNLLNLIKIKALECFNHIYRYLFENVPNKIKAESPFLRKG
jgi:hypothetical protein